MQLLVSMERISIGLIQPEDSDPLARANWALKQKVISNAMGILNAFVPVYYQDIHRYWVIKKFYGAAMRIANEDVRWLMPERQIILTIRSFQIPILRTWNEHCHISSRNWSKFKPVSHLVRLDNLPNTSSPKPWLMHSVI